MKKRFTLIELAIVLLILVLIGSIITPNVKEYNETAQERSNTIQAGDLQIAIDMFYQDNEMYPTIEQPTPSNPQKVDFTQLVPKYLRYETKIPNAKYWIDYSGKLWIGFLDSPTDITNNEGVVTWNPVEGATNYEVYEVKDTSTTIGFINSSKYELILKTVTTETRYIGEPNKEYVVSTLDTKGIKSVPVGVGYIGYTENTIVVIGNKRPVAIITMTPNMQITSATPIQLDYMKSYNENGDEIIDAEWQIDYGKTVKNITPQLLPKGIHTIQLRVKDVKGIWSEWTKNNFEVKDGSVKPTINITMTPEENINMNTNISFDYTLTGQDNVVKQIEWQLDNLAITNIPPSGKFNEGMHLVKLRVQNNEGVWSEWTTKVFEVKQVTNKPEVSVTLNPNTNIDTNTYIIYDFISSNLQESKIVKIEWQLDENPITNLSPSGRINKPGIHTIKARIQTEQGLWSDWNVKTFKVTEIPYTPENQSNETLVESSSNIKQAIYHNGKVLLIADAYSKEYDINNNAYSIEKNFDYIARTYTWDAAIDNNGTFWRIVKDLNDLSAYVKGYNPDTKYSYSKKLLDIPDDKFLGISTYNNQLIFTTGNSNNLYLHSLNLDTKEYKKEKIQEGNRLFGGEIYIDKEGNKYISYGMYRNSRDYDLYIKKISMNNSIQDLHIMSGVSWHKEGNKIAITEDLSGRLWIVAETETSSNESLVYTILNKDMSIYKNQKTIGYSMYNPSLITKEDGNIFLFYQDYGYKYKYIKFTK